MTQLALAPKIASTYQLNQGQQAAADAFFKFLLSDETEFGISGPGGVGKTYLMGYLIDEIMPRYAEMCSLLDTKPKFTEVMMTATTNKAAEQLSLSTGRECVTIHSFLRLKLRDDYKTGKTILSKRQDFVVHERMIIFVDEASMIDSDLYRVIHEGTQNCKIVYVGDHCQLAPVMESLSPVYRRGIEHHVLTEPMRNAGQPALMALCQQFRNSVETGIFYPIKLVPGVIDLLEPAEMEKEVHSHFLNQGNHNRLLAYTNQRVIDYNNHIRWIRSLPEEYTEGETLVNAQALHLKQRILSIESEITILSFDPITEMLDVGQGAQLEIQKATIRDHLGGIIENVQIPVDPNHFKELVAYFQKNKDWESYFFLKNMVADFRPKDASTVYKAQGSTYDTVFIDLENISTCRNPDQAARMLYVAVSRPRNRIVFYGKLNPKYGSIIQ